MKRLLTVLFASFLLSGCASMLTSSAYPVFFDSAPEQSAFIINNKNGVEIARGQTPSIIALETGSGFFDRADYMVHFSKPNYQAITYRLVASGSPWYFANFLNIFGFLIDAATGAMWKLPSQLLAVLPQDPYYKYSHPGKPVQSPK